MSEAVNLNDAISTEVLPTAPVDDAIGGALTEDKPCVVESVPVSDHSSSPENENCASVDLAIQSKAISVSLRSRASLSPDVVSLSAQVRLLTEQLAEATTKLEEAHYKLGFLEAELLFNKERLSELRNNRSSCRGIKNWLNKLFS